MTALERDSLASEWTRRGIGLLGTNTEASLLESVHCFETAIELRRPLPLEENPWSAYGLAAGWMNRGDALTRLGGPERLSAAVDSYDRALEAVSHLRPGESPLFRRRIAICWLNRGHTVQCQGRVEEAAHCFDAAIELIRPAAEEHPVVLASALANRAGVFLHHDESLAALEAAGEAVGLLPALEKEEAGAAETALKSRLLACRALSNLAARRDAAMDDPISEAIDHAEDGLALAHHWERRGDARFQQLAMELFRFGAHAYGIHQPQFLAEFVDEHTRSMPFLRPHAREAFLFAFRTEIQRQGFRSLVEPGSGQLAGFLDASMRASASAHPNGR